MPAVNVAMERSLREGFVQLLVASLRPAIQKRDIQGQVNDVKTAFSSWDNCMKATYCKWPVIAVIIVGGLFLISIIWCVARCLCCGLSCCCECCQCLKCCGNCCGCCDPPKGSRAKYLDEPYVPPNNQYKSQPPMDPGFARAAAIPPPARAAAVPEPPQYAEFDVSKKTAAPVNEDALPEMPSWEGAGSKKVLLEEDAVEMDTLKKPEASVQNAALAGTAAAGAIAGPSSPAPSPVVRSPYGPPTGIPGSNGYFPPAPVEVDAYSQHTGHMDGYQQPGAAYSQASIPVDQGYGVAGAAVMGPGRRSPRAYNDAGYNNGVYGQGRGYGPPARQGSYDTRQEPYDNYGSQSQGSQGYGVGAARRSPQSPYDAQQSTPYPQDLIQPPPAARADYGAQGDYHSQSNYHQADYSALDDAYNSYDSRPATGRQYSSDSTRPLQAPSSTSSQRQQQLQPQQYAHEMPANETGSFDFDPTAYSRPTPGPAANANAGGYRQPSPIQLQPQGAAASSYQGYQPYQPPSQRQQQNSSWGRAQ
ncbi:hypothetical protein B0T26DRAFT_47633 [Lasiosphaeria miniovina]|uniref:Fibroin-3 related protein n=1 Tax=Lasiosphaeria miniovina TaxID=1954250 RepID=A0AA40BGV6_9PEZI|nr:uncharacterized protein B0T26DRAFT_47633 [Lasiosphaeria miniovina]KAK0734004.1 hypothetical protein B0T26DRAFT_47633 [Lasiosphaeria miniovina]